MTEDMLNSLKALMRNEIREFESFKDTYEEELERYNSLSRSERRSNKSINKRKILYNVTKNILNCSDKLLECIENNQPITEDSLFKILLIYLHDYTISEVFGVDSNGSAIISPITRDFASFFVNECLSYFVNLSKLNNSNLKILNCFDENGKLISSECYKFKDYVISACEEYSIGEDKDLYCSMYIPQRVINEYNEMVAQMAEKKRLEKEERKKQKRLERKNSVASNNLSTNTKLNNHSELEIEVYSKYIDEKSLELKKDAIDNISVDNLMDKLRKLPWMTKKKLDEYYSAYNGLFVKREIDRICSIIGKDGTRKLKNIPYEVIYNFILSDSYSGMSNESIIDFVNSYVNEDNTKNKESNIIVFPYDGFYDDEVNTILKSSSYNNRESIINSFNQQFLYLRTQNPNDIAKNKSNAFHEIKDTRTGDLSSVPLIINNNLKAYRYGNKESKVCTIRLSVSEKNGIMLKEKYGLSNRPYVILCFALGNVLCEKEKDFYNRAIKNSSIFEDNLAYIASLFREDFNNDTFAEACALIDSSFRQMGGMGDEEMSLV